MRILAALLLAASSAHAHADPAPPPRPLTMMDTSGRSWAGASLSVWARTKGTFGGSFNTGLVTDVEVDHRIRPGLVGIARIPIASAELHREGGCDTCSRPEEGSPIGNLTLGIRKVWPGAVRPGVSATVSLPTARSVADGDLTADAELAGDAALFIPYNTTIKLGVAVAADRGSWIYEAALVTDVFVPRDLPRGGFPDECAPDDVNVGYQWDDVCVSEVYLGVRSSFGATRRAGQWALQTEASIRLGIGDDRFSRHGRSSQRFAANVGARHDAGFGVWLTLPGVFDPTPSPSGLSLGLGFGRRY